MQEIIGILEAHEQLLITILVKYALRALKINWESAGMWVLLCITGKKMYKHKHLEKPLAICFRSLKSNSASGIYSKEAT